MRKIKDIMNSVGDCFKGTKLYTVGIGAYYKVQKVEITYDAKTLYEGYSDNLDEYVNEQMLNNAGLNIEEITKNHEKVKQNYIESLDYLSNFDSDFDSNYIDYIEADSVYIDKLKSMDSSDRKIALSEIKNKLRNDIVRNVDKVRGEYDLSLNNFVHYESVRDTLREHAENSLKEVTSNMERNKELDAEINKINSYEKKSSLEATKLIGSKVLNKVSNKCNVIKESTLAVATRAKQFSKNKLGFIFNNQFEKTEASSLENEKFEDNPVQKDNNMSLFYMMGDTYASLLEENKHLKEENKKLSEKLNEREDLLKDVGETDVVENKENTEPKEIIENEPECANEVDIEDKDVEINALRDALGELMNKFDAVTKELSDVKKALNSVPVANVDAIAKAEESVCKFGVKNKVFEDVSVQSDNSIALENSCYTKNIKDEFRSDENMKDKFENTNIDKEEEIYSLNDVDIEHGDIDFMGM